MAAAEPVTVAALGDTLFPAESLFEAWRQELSVTSNVLIRLRLAHPVLAVATAAGVVSATLWLVRDAAPAHARLARVLVGLLAVQLAAGPDLLHDADHRVRHHDADEQPVLRTPGDQHQGEQRQHDRVDDREHVGRHDLLFRHAAGHLAVGVVGAVDEGEDGAAAMCDAVERSLLIGTCLLVLIVELLNSGIEAAVDRTGTEHHPLAGRAKDLGSAAVFVSLLLLLVVWALIGWARFSQ